MYVLERKTLYIVPEPLTKNRTCQSYRWTQYAVSNKTEPLEALRSGMTRPEEWRIVPMADSVNAQSEEVSQ